MDCFRTLNLTIISARGLKSLTKYDVYVVVRGTGGKKFQTPVLRDTGSTELTWNFPMNFIIDEAACLKDRLNLVIKIKAVRWRVFGKTLGKARVPIKDLMSGIKDEGKESQLATYPVKGEAGASLTFSYEFGEKFFLREKNFFAGHGGGYGCGVGGGYCGGGCGGCDGGCDGGCGGCDGGCGGCDGGCGGCDGGCGGCGGGCVL